MQHKTNHTNPAEEHVLVDSLTCGTLKQQKLTAQHTMRRESVYDDATVWESESETYCPPASNAVRIYLEEDSSRIC